MSTTEQALPSRVNPYRLMAEPKRASERSDIADPTFKVSSALSDEPTRAIP
jgi:hypothetical protein